LAALVEAEDFIARIGRALGRPDKLTGRVL
jgi:hypothetical protein